MKKKLFALVLGVFLTMPCLLHAEEVEIQLMEVVGMEVLPGDNPLDDPEQADPRPTRPTDFRATIDGTTMSVSKQESMIPSAQATVVNAATGSLVFNQQFTSAVVTQIATPGVYVLRIETATGALVGQFRVR
jgi:hypothetical protein